MSKHYIQKGDIHTYIIKKDNEMQIYIGTEIGIKALGDIEILNKIKGFVLYNYKDIIKKIQAK